VGSPKSSMPLTTPTLLQGPNKNIALIWDITPYMLLEVSHISVSLILLLVAGISVLLTPF